MYSSRWFMHLGVKSGTTGRRWWNRRGIYANKTLFYIILCVSCRHFLLCEWCHAFKSFFKLSELLLMGNLFICIIEESVDFFFSKMFIFRYYFSNCLWYTMTFYWPTTKCFFCFYQSPCIRQSFVVTSPCMWRVYAQHTKDLTLVR